MIKSIFLFFGILLTSNVLACNFGTTHPVMWHYNQMDKVFVGTVIKVGNPSTMDFAYREKDTNIPTYKIRLVVHESYRGDMPDTIDIGKIALAKILFSEGETYLIYANYMEADNILATGSILHVLDPRMEKHNVLKEISKNPNQNVIEYHPFTGEKWAEGEIVNGEPSGEWNYYEITGELKEKGKYKKGKRQGKWITYFVTDARFYNLFQAIKIGRAGAYEFVSHKETTSPKSLYQYEMIYIDRRDGSEKIVEYLYKNPVKERVTKFKNGKLHGKDKVYNDHGDLTGYQSYKNGRLDGRGRFMEIRVIDGKEYKTVFESVYKNGQAYSETIYHFENGKLENTEEIIAPQKF
ncbi:MAG: hypothetical protein AB8G11_04090 [Saprospiraceae bacterium]